jgi:hypothetical protein
MPELPLLRRHSDGFRCGIFGASGGEIPQDIEWNNRRRAAKASNFAALISSGVGARLALIAAEGSVFRAAVFSIVLTLAIGPNATLLCSVWCHPHEVKTSACQHQGATTSPQVTGEDSCRTVVATLTAFVREEGKRGQQTSQPAVSVAQFGLAVPRTDATRNPGPNTAPAVVSPPILIALRI